MRIAIIAEVFLPKVDGVVGRTLSLIQQLLSHGDDVVVVCPAASQPRQSPVRLIEFPGFPCVTYPEYVIGRPDQRLIQELRAFQPDVVHFLNPFAFGFQCYDLLSRSDLRIPSLFSFHTLYGEFVRQYPGLTPLSHLLWWLMRSYHNTADRNLTVSPVMADDLTRRGFQRVDLWPPAVDSSKFSPDRRCATMRRRLQGAHPDSPLLLTVSRLAPEKNVRFLAEILQRVPAATLGIVGDGPQRQELERRFAGHKATFVGYLRGDELAAAYASADAFIYASETETMGNVILEAMASGLPVIAVNAGGIPSLIQHGCDGFLFAGRNSDEAAEYLRGILDSPEKHARVAQAALTSVRTRSWRDSGNAVRAHYGQIRNNFDAASREWTCGRRPGWGATLTTAALVRLFQLAACRSRQASQQKA